MYVWHLISTLYLNITITTNMSRQSSVDQGRNVTETMFDRSAIFLIDIGENKIYSKYILPSGIIIDLIGAGIKYR